MASFAAKYLVSGATGGVTRTVGGFSDELSNRVHGSLESADKKELERSNRELERKEEKRKKQYQKKEAERQQLREAIRGKYGIEKRKSHDPMTTHTGLMSPHDERTILLEEEESGDECSPCCSTPCSCLDYLTNLWSDRARKMK